MNNNGTIQELSLFGGPLHRLGSRLGLARESNTTMLGLTLGLLAWTVLIVLAVTEGFGPKILSVAVVGIHVRFLVAIPLFFVCETWVAPKIAEFARYLTSAGLVAETSLPALASDIARIRRMNNSWLPELVFVVIAFGLPLTETIGILPRGTGSWSAMLQSAGDRVTWMHAWYLGFCLPLFRFLLLRCFWRFGLWCYFLCCVQRLRLQLMPTHSDGAAGLGYVEIVHEAYNPLAAAISALFSAQFAEALALGSMQFETLYRLVPMVMLVAGALFIAPLLVFSSKLWLCRTTGLSEYMSLAARYVNAFDRKWIRGETPSEPFLGASDMQSLADLTTSLDVVRKMRLIPCTERLVTQLGVSVIVPLLPLLLLKYPLDHVAARLFQVLTGL